MWASSLKYWDGEHWELDQIPWESSSVPAVLEGRCIWIYKSIPMAPKLSFVWFLMRLYYVNLEKE